MLLQGADDSREVEAWTLNVSLGGVRLVVEEPICVGAVYAIKVGDQEARSARVVWLREEADGQIAGLKFEDGDESPSSSFPVPG